MHGSTETNTTRPTHVAAAPIDTPLTTLELARATHSELRDLARLAGERRDQVVRILTAIDHHRTGQDPTSLQTALELDGMRDEMLDLLGRIHASTDPYTAWAVSEPGPADDEWTVLDVAALKHGGSERDSGAEEVPRISVRCGDPLHTSNDSECALVGVDDHGLINTWNLQAERLLGWAAADVVGQPVARIVPSDEVAHVAARLGKVLSNGEAETHTARRLHRDGHWVEVVVTPVAVFTEDDGVVGGVASYEPVRRAADAA